MPARLSLSGLPHLAHRAHRVWRMLSLVPPRWRRPDLAARLGLIGGCLWFAIMFAALAHTGNLSAPPRTAFALAAAAGAAGALCASVRRYQWSVTMLGAMLAAGQLTAVVQHM